MANKRSYPAAPECHGSSRRGAAGLDDGARERLQPPETVSACPVTQWELGPAWGGLLRAHATRVASIRRHFEDRLSAEDLRALRRIWGKLAAVEAPAP
ncbi:hypothetical protein ACPW96_13370 [Micromonospora sp. DT81.3]|uniref:hypothetical protein n=1 Tax=Micromonospora sp. DT81.3 TaxID=3416523 RepID=UPI003CE96889